jgi:hypothetical protein
MMVPCGERTAVDLSTKSTLFSEVCEYQTSKKTTRAGFEMNAVGYDGTRSRRSGHTTRRNVRFYHESSDVDDSPESNKHEGHLVKRVQGAQQKSPEQSQKPIATTQPSRLYLRKPTALGVRIITGLYRDLLPLLRLLSKVSQERRKSIAAQ